MKKLAKAAIYIVFALVFYFTGYAVGHKNLIFESNYRPTIINKEFAKPKTLDFSIFWDAWNKIEEDYVGKVDQQKMIYGAVRGMVESLGDSHSSFMDPEETSNFMNELSGEFSGIGAEIGLKEDRITIVAPLVNSPAERAGLKPLDKIIKIDNQDTENMTVDEAVTRIRGKAGTEVTLQILRDGWTELQNIKIKREKITVNSVKWEMKNDIAYLQITQFGDDTTDLARKAAREIKEKNPKAIILDLRSNPGGYLESSIDVASLFLDEKVVVKEKYKDDHIEENKTKGEAILKDYKTYVLVNGGSASASEILAGALQDYKQGILIGEPTFGKGSVQDLKQLQNNSTLRITIAKWLTPLDRAIDKVGIEPDIKVKLTEEDYKAGRDPQLDRAIEEAGRS